MSDTCGHDICGFYGQRSNERCNRETGLGFGRAKGATPSGIWGKRPVCCSFRKAGGSEARHFLCMASQAKGSKYSGPWQPAPKTCAACGGGVRFAIKPKRQSQSAAGCAFVRGLTGRGCQRRRCPALGAAGSGFIGMHSEALNHAQFHRQPSCVSGSGAD
jgi:hypothetical protein